MILNLEKTAQFDKRFKHVLKSIIERYFILRTLKINLHNGRALGFTIFHDCALPPDDFVANCKVTFDHLKPDCVNDFWTDLEPHGQLHLSEFVSIYNFRCIVCVCSCAVPNFKPFKI